MVSTETLRRLIDDPAFYKCVNPDPAVQKRLERQYDAKAEALRKQKARGEKQRAERTAAKISGMEQLVEQMIALGVDPMTLLGGAGPAQSLPSA